MSTVWWERLKIVCKVDEVISFTVAENKAAVIKAAEFDAPIQTLFLMPPIAIKSSSKMKFRI